MYSLRAISCPNFHNSLKTIAIANLNYFWKTLEMVYKGKKVVFCNSLQSRVNHILTNRGDIDHVQVDLLSV